MKKAAWFSFRVFLGIAFWGVVILHVLWFFQVGFFGDFDFGPFWVKT